MSFTYIKFLNTSCALYKIVTNTKWSLKSQCSFSYNTSVWGHELHIKPKIISNVFCTVSVLIKYSHFHRAPPHWVTRLKSPGNASAAVHQLCFVPQLKIIAENQKPPEWSLIKNFILWWKVTVLTLLLQTLHSSRRFPLWFTQSPVSASLPDSHVIDA